MIAPIPADIILVNPFRIVFNEYFGANLSILDNEYYFRKDLIYLYPMNTIGLKEIEQKYD